MEDPYWRDNELKATRLMEKDYIYERKVWIDGAFLEHDVILLCCHGLDTVAELRWNGKIIGKVDNMHRTWELILNLSAWGRKSSADNIPFPDTLYKRSLS